MAGAPCRHVSLGPGPGAGQLDVGGGRAAAVGPTGWGLKLQGALGASRTPSPGPWHRLMQACGTDHVWRFHWHLGGWTHHY